MKKRIRLTESQLHNVIKKCVNEALTEMDPETYASYANKRAAQGEYDKAIEGSNAAAKSWNRKYGQNGKYLMRPYGNISRSGIGGYEIANGLGTDIGVMGKSYSDSQYSFKPQSQGGGWDVYRNEQEEDFNDRFVPSDLQQGYETAKRMNGRNSRIDRHNPDSDDDFAEYNN